MTEQGPQYWSAKNRMIDLLFATSGLTQEELKFFAFDVLFDGVRRVARGEILSDDLHEEARQHYIEDAKRIIIEVEATWSLA